MYMNIEAEMARRSVKKQDLANLLSVSRNTVHSWVSGKTPIPSTALQKMSSMWGVTTDYLLTAYGNEKDIE